MKAITVLTYNIHKGFTTGNARFVLREIRESIAAVGADLVLLQEVVGQCSRRAKRVREWPSASQFEFLADQAWPHHAYGRNAVYASGHHGNAILSCFPILNWENEDVSRGKIERRGLLHAEVDVPWLSQPLHVLCTHLGLFEADRMKQVEQLARRVHRMVHDEAPAIVAGDFNDWRERVSPALKKEAGFEEAFVQSLGTHARTYPSWPRPVLCLDRIYYRGLRCESAETLQGGSWARLSDHLPLLARFSAG